MILLILGCFADGAEILPLILRWFPDDAGILPSIVRWFADDPGILLLIIRWFPDDAGIFSKLLLQISGPTLHLDWFRRLRWRIFRLLH